MCLHGQILLGRECDEKVDLYSFGVVLWEISSGCQPEGRRLRPLVPEEEAPAAAIHMIQRCLSEEANQRPSAYDMVQFLANLQ